MSIASRAFSAVAITAVALLSSGGVAGAALVSHDGEVHGCVAKSGLLRVVAASAKCKADEQSISFAAQGKTGPAGPKGPAGSAGAQGSQGAPGTPADASTISALQTKVSTLETEVASLQATLAGVSRNGSTLRMSGLNLQLDSGAGSTSAPVNGLGNLFIGDNGSPGVQTGSNNLVIDDGQTFTSYGGLVAGTSNSIEAPSATVTGGTNNVASASSSTVAGGELNSATGLSSFIGGGCANVAGPGSGSSSDCATVGDQAVVGGYGGVASGRYSTVAGGLLDLASGIESVAAGGQDNIASDELSMTSAGCDNVSGSATASTQTCFNGGEAIDGGANNTYNVKDGTGGLISDVSETNSTMTINNLVANGCINLGIDVNGGAVGDSTLFTFPTTGSVIPSYLRLTPLGISVAGNSAFSACNSSGSTISGSWPIKILAFR